MFQRHTTKVSSTRLYCTTPLFGSRKGTNGVSTNEATANFISFGRWAFWVLPLTYFYLPKSGRAYLFPQTCQKSLLLQRSGPISVDPICPQPRLAGRREPPRRQPLPRALRDLPALHLLPALDLPAGGGSYVTTTMCVFACLFYIISYTYIEHSLYILIIVH